MSPSITKFLTEGAEEADQKNHHVDQLVQYLDENLTTMSSHLSQENFEQVLTSTFDKVSHILFKVVQNGIKVRVKTAVSIVLMTPCRLQKCSLLRTLKRFTKGQIIFK